MARAVDAAAAQRHLVVGDLDHVQALRPQALEDSKLPDALAIRVRNNGKAGFANFDAPALKASRDLLLSSSRPNRT